MEAEGEIESIPQRFGFSFEGNAREYFGIWIVNLTLSILTLGIYSAWAKVRTNRYFYGNTLIAGSAFDYTAEPLQILKGRIIAVIFLIAYQVSIRFYPSLANFSLVLFFGFVPAIYVVSLAFKMRYSSWRGVSFSFAKDFSGAYSLFSPIFLYLLLTALIPFLLDLSPEDIVGSEEEGPVVTPELTIYFASSLALILLFMGGFPYWQKLYYQFIGNRTQFGQSKFDLALSTKTFYGIYLKSAGLVLLGFLFAFVMIFVFSESLNETSEASLELMLIGFYGAVLIPYLFAFAYIQTRLTNTIYSEVALGGIRFESSLNYWRMVYFYTTNALAIIFSIGLAIPWAKIRLARYRCDCMTLLAVDLESLVGDIAEDVDAKADAFSDLFDLDIGL